jgi:hypothetical protein
MSGYKNTFQEYNTKRYEANNYENVFSEEYNKQLSLQNESDIAYEFIDYFLTISSFDRDRSVHSNVNQYTINLPKEYKNIYSIELIQAILPDKNSITSEPFLLLHISELEDVMSSLNRHISDSFAILQIGSPNTPGGFIYMDKRVHENTVKYYQTPKASLAKLTIRITDIYGNLFNFGSDTSPPTAPAKDMQNTFIFKITCLEKKRQSINHRNVY